MQLSVPIFRDGVVFDRCEIQKPKAGVLANTLEIFENQGEFPAILDFISNSITALIDIENNRIENKAQIKGNCRRMSYITAEVVAIKAMLLINKEDWIEGVYKCPRCQKQIITGVDNDLGQDTRDKIIDLEIINQGEDENDEINQDDYCNIIHIDLEEPIKIMHAKTDNILHEINSIGMRYPTLDDCINGERKYPQNKEAKRQFAIFAEALEKINNESIKIKWKKIWAEFIFNQLDFEDLAKIGEALNEYGLKRTIKKTCRFCGKIWDAPVNTSNFFVSGLRSI